MVTNLSDTLMIVRHEHTRYIVEMCATAQKMRVWPLEAGLQEQASNRLKLLW